LVSKPPDPEVLETINTALRSVKKPMITMFVGAPATDGPRTLGEAALMALAASRGEQPTLVRELMATADQKIRRRASEAASNRTRGQRYLRGLFSGGTFCAEAQAVFSDNGLLAEFHSNVPIAGVAKLRNSLRSEQHTVVDLGEDEFTVGRPHPMIDFSLRNRRILEEATDPETAIILLDVILGYGSHPDPAGELSEVIRNASEKVMVVCSVTGTEHDPQNSTYVKTKLEEAGAIVMPSNGAASKLAAYTVKHLEGVRAQTV
jgi:FdrA protein